MEEIPQKEIPAEDTENIKVINGQRYRMVKNGYTLREFYSRTTDTKGPGPGWDYRTQLLNNEYALERFGRTFTDEEVYDPSKLPDVPYYDWELIEE